MYNPDSDGCWLVVYPEVEDPIVVLIKVLPGNNLIKKVLLKCQSSNRCKKPAISCGSKHETEGNQSMLKLLS